jgi:heme oxygenase
MPLVADPPLSRRVRADTRADHAAAQGSGFLDALAAGLVAHHYTRYLGDLSGGQYLGLSIAAAYGLDGEGHRFFVFEGVDPPAFRARYRALLDEAPWSRAEQDMFLAEVTRAYRSNIDVLDELRERWA